MSNMRAPLLRINCTAYTKDHPKRQPVRWHYFCVEGDTTREIVEEATAIAERLGVTKCYAIKRDNQYEVADRGWWKKAFGRRIRYRFVPENARRSKSAP